MADRVATGPAGQAEKKSRPTALGGSEGGSECALSAPVAQDWSAHIATYNAVQFENAQVRVAAMSDADRRAYSAKYNTLSEAHEHILDHMQRWGGFRGMVMSGSLVRKDSALFNRLLSGHSSLPHPPPLNEGKPWYALFDEPGRFECAVTVRGQSVRRRDKEKGIWLLEINGGPWECVGGDERAKQLLALDRLWQSDPASRRVTWLQVNALLDSALRDPRGRVAIAFDLRFGQWPNAFELCLEPRPQSPSQAQAQAQAQASMPPGDSVFAWASAQPDFAWRWMLGHAAQV